MCLLGTTLCRVYLTLCLLEGTLRAMNTTTFWELLRAFPFGIESRRLTVYFLAAAVLLEVLFSPLSHAPVAARAGVLILMSAGIGLWLAASVRYVLAWDELQRRALAESGTRGHYEA